MKLREKGKADGEPVHMSWDQAQAALAAGTHEVAEGADIDQGSKPGSITQDDGRAGDESDDLDAKTKAELEALAKERGVDISTAKTKADILEALRKA